MKKLDNFNQCFRVLRGAEREKADKDELYRMGVIGQFHLTFELAWKALQAVLRLHAIEAAESGSPRELLKLGYKIGFVHDADIWLDMLKRRNQSVHIYDEEKVEQLLEKIFSDYIPAFERLSAMMEQKVREAEENWD